MENNKVRAINYLYRVARITKKSNGKTLRVRIENLEVVDGNGVYICETRLGNTKKRVDVNDIARMELLDDEAQARLRALRLGMESLEAAFPAETLDGLEPYEICKRDRAALEARGVVEYPFK